MKFFEDWIREYYKSNYNISNIINTLNKNGFEVSNFNINNINKKYILKKILIHKNINKKISKIKIYNNISLYINNIKENLKNKIILIKKKYIKKKIIFLYYKIKIQNNYIFILYTKKKKNKKKLIKRYNYLEINIPYNRFDCNNVYGLARELSILNKNKCVKKKNKIKDKIKNNYYIKIKNINKKHILNYKYLIIKKINLNKFKTPELIKKRLKKLDIKNKNKIIDVIWYILIESGQKIICLNLNKIIKYNKKKHIYKKNKNKIYLKINNINKFIIKKKTNKILLIAPLYNIKYIKKLKKNNFNSINKYLNNIDKNTQIFFLEKISYILTKICGGKTSNIITKKKKQKKKKYINLIYKDINNKIGIIINKKYIIRILKKIKCKLKIKKKKIYVKPPSWRYDLKIKEDLIEEIIKIYGYNNIPSKTWNTKLIFNQENYYQFTINKIKNYFTNIGYQEVINFHFSNFRDKNIFKDNHRYIEIINPISKDMTLMRTSLIPGLIKNICINNARQKKNIKFFEIGTCYKKNKNKIKQEIFFSAIIYGYKNKENWFIKKKSLFDYFDIKGDLEIFLKKINKYYLYDIKKSKYRLLDNNENTKIFFKKKNIGFIGKLNKKIQNYYSLKYPIYLFEIKIKNIFFSINKKIKNISKYPSITRDITIIIPNYIWITKIINKCYLININKIKKINIIKTYINKKLKKEKKKNITLRILIQDNYKTLENYEINKIIDQCKKMIKKKFFASIIDK